MLKKLKIKFVLINMVIVTVMLSIIFGLVYQFTAVNLENDSIAMMYDLAEHPYDMLLPSFSENSDVYLPYFTIQINAQGEVLATSGGYHDMNDKEFVKNVLNATFNCGEQMGVLDEYNLRFYESYTLSGLQIVYVDISSEIATLNNLVKTFSIIGVISFAVFLVISLLFARWAVRPVDKAWKQQRQFVADASHELKTPLTVILTNAEMMQNIDNSPESTERFSSNILIMARQMRSLVEQLLNLARADNEQFSVAHEDMDFSKLVSDALLPFEPIFFEKGLMLDSNAIEENITVNGDKEKLKQVVEILLDNAQKYSEPNGTTTVELKRTNRSHCTLQVSNPGIEISQADLKNIFKRFYQVDESRTQSGSFGLGLSIAETIVTRHKGRIWAESKDGVISFFVELTASQKSSEQG